MRSRDEMTCDQFADRMNELLDDRQLPSLDGPLLSHAEKCPPCDARLHVACQLEAVLFSTTSVSTSATIQKPGRRRKIGLTALAVAAVLAWVMVQPAADRPGPSDQGTAAVIVSDTEAVVIVPGLSSDAVAWWSPENGQPWTDAKQWIDNSMPAVESVRDGVAPIGRSLRRAVRILAVGRGDQTS